MATTEFDIPGYPFFLQEDPASTTPIYYSAADFRSYTASFQRRVGVLGSAHFRVTQANNVGFKISVNAGYANISGNYIVRLPNTSEITLDWTTPTSGTVTHKVFIAVFDELISGTTNKAKIVITQDVGAGAPNPAGAAAFLQLATLKVTSGQANIQDQHIVNTAPHGGSAADYVGLAPYLLTGYEGFGGAVGVRDFSARYDSGIVRLYGRVRKANGTEFATGTEVRFGNLHPNFYPDYNQYATGVTSVSTGTGTGTCTFRLTINNDGTMSAFIPDTNKVLLLTFDGITFDLD